MKTEIAEIYYKSDFKFVLHLFDATETEIFGPQFDWRARFYTGAKSFVAQCIGGVCTNCYVDDEGAVHIVANSHGLAPGELLCEFRAFIDSERFPDGTEDVIHAAPLGIVLTMSHCDCPRELSATVQLPAYVRNLDQNLAAIEEAIGCSLDEINRRLEQLLGREPAEVPSTPVEAVGKRGITPAYLTRGAIPFHAETGRVYRNCGYIKYGPVTPGEPKTIVPPTVLTLNRFLNEEDPVVLQLRDGARYDLEFGEVHNPEKYVMPRAYITNYSVTEFPYIRKNAAGEFELLEEGDVDVVDRALAPPVIPMMPKGFEPTDYESKPAAIAALLGVGVHCIELQRRKKKKGALRKKWAKSTGNGNFKSEPTGWLQGVFRVRFVRKKIKSEWTYFSAKGRSIQQI